MSSLKEYVVVQHIAGERPMLWTKKDLESHLNWSKEHNRIIKIKLLHDFSDELKDSPYQGSAGVWVKASERLPKVGIYNALYNGDHVIFQVHDGGFRVINYHGEKNDSPKLFLIRYLDDSAATPAGDGEAIEILKELCWLKSHKDNVGKDSVYEQRQPEAWKRANEFLNSLVKTGKP